VALEAANHAVKTGKYTVLWHVLLILALCDAATGHGLSSCEGHNSQRPQEQERVS